MMRIVSAAPVQLVCFDLGGVVIRICRSWPEGCAAAGLDLREHDPSMSNGADGWHAHRELTDLYQTGRISSLEFAHRLSREMKSAYSPEEILSVHDAWMLGEYGGIIKLIDRIHEMGLRSAALSNTNERHWMLLAAYPSFHRLRHRFASHELGFAKPDTRIYRAFERAAGCCGDAILFFDDLAENVTAARACGWRAERIDPCGDTTAQIAAFLPKHGIG